MDLQNIPQISWETLPPHLLENICKNKCFRELNTMKLVCRSWNEEIKRFSYIRTMLNLSRKKSSERAFLLNYSDEFVRNMLREPSFFSLKLKLYSIDSLKMISKEISDRITELDITLILPPETNERSILNVKSFNKVESLKMYCDQNKLFILKLFKNLKSFSYLSGTFDRKSFNEFLNFHEAFTKLKTFEMQTEWCSKEELKLLIDVLPANLENLALKNFQLCQTTLNRIIYKFCNLKTLNYHPLELSSSNSLINLPEIHLNIQGTLILNDNLPNLTVLNTSEIGIDDGLIFMICKTSRNLKRLAFMGVGCSHISFIALKEISKNLTHLEELIIHEGSLIYYDFYEGEICNFPNLKCLELSLFKTDVECLVKLKGNKLKKLGLKNVADLYDTNLLLISKNLPNIEIFHLEDCKRFISISIPVNWKQLHSFSYETNNFLFASSIASLVEKSNLYFVKLFCTKFSEYDVDILKRRLNLREGFYLF